MVQGTTSDAGKSTLVAGLCRLLADQGWQVAPFKPQNMALNSAVTIDGGEIGRAQALQAQAARLEPHTDFNPVLLKPASDKRCQVIIQGKALTSLEASQFFGEQAKGYKQLAMTKVLESFSRLTQQYQMVFIEGAGSPAEINLRENDIANMGFAEAADCPVILIADIDKGGVFAHLVGTLALLSESERARVKGFVINRFRGDISLLQSGLDWLEQETGKPVLGVLPYLHDLHLDAEDALIASPSKSAAPKLKVLVLVWPRISNHTDFDPLRLHPNVEFSYYSLKTAKQQSVWPIDSANDDYADPSLQFPEADLIILPGSKNVREDLSFMLAHGWDKALERHIRYGGKVLGICGGYQMLGHLIDDPNGVEGEAGSSEGLGLLPMVTELRDNKALERVQGELGLKVRGQLKSAPVVGYEIHCGVSKVLLEQERPMSLRTRNNDHAYAEGMTSQDNHIMGTYLHGLFDTPEAGQLLLEWAGASQISAVDINQVREQQLDRLANTLSEHLDLQKLQQIMEA